MRGSVYGMKCGERGKVGKWEKRMEGGEVVKGGQKGRIEGENLFMF